MKMLKLIAVALALVAASATTANARDYYRVSVGSGYDYTPQVGYSSNYSLGYSNRPRVIYEPTVVYYAQPTRCYQPVVIQPVEHGFYGGHHNHHGYRDHREDRGQSYGFRAYRDSRDD